MKSKISITLDSAVVALVDRLTKKDESRSETIERLLREGLEARRRRAADERDRRLLDRHAGALNREVGDVLDYQADV